MEVPRPRDDHLSKSTEDDFCSPPDWLTNEYIEGALRYGTNDKLLLVKFVKIVPGTKKGENFASIMYRIHVEYVSSKDDQMIKNCYLIKISFEENEFVNDILSKFEVCKREMDMYGKFLPSIKKLLESSGIDGAIYPEAVYVDYEHSAIMMNDLSVKSYKIGDRTKGLDMTHTKMVLERLARLHAASAVMNENEPGIFRSCDRGIFNRYTNAFSPLYEKSIENIADLVSKWDSHKCYEQKLRQLQPFVMEYTTRCYDANEKRFNVLGHGDAWVNNIMFLYNSRNEPIDVLLIDFQYSVYTSPCVDIHYFMNTSMEEHLRLQNSEQLFQFYYYNLKNNLQKLNFKANIPSLSQLWSQHNDTSFYAFVSASIVQPLFYNRNTENADFEALFKNDERGLEFKRKLYDNEIVQKNIKRLLPYFDQRGLLDLQ